MLDRDAVRGFFSLFSDLDEEECLRWQALCDNAAAYLERRLRPDTDLEAGRERLCTAAGALATCDYLLMANSGTLGSSELRVGDVSVKDSASATARDGAREIRSYFLEQVDDLLLPDMPVLRSVGGETA